MENHHAAMLFIYGGNSWKFLEADFSSSFCGSLPDFKDQSRPDGVMRYLAWTFLANCTCPPPILGRNDMGLLRSVDHGGSNLMDFMDQEISKLIQI